MPSPFRRHGSSRRAFARVALLLTAIGGVSCAAITRAGAVGGSFSGTSADVTDHATREDIVNARGTYIDRVLAEHDSVLDRWPNRVDDPIRVWIDAPPDSAFVESVHLAFDDWVGTGIPVRFRYVGDKKNAEVIVRWVTKLPDKTGSTTWRSTRDGWLRNGEITLATHMTSGKSLDANGVYAIALHEIGHAIGLSHSNDDRDIMAPMVHVGELSETDRATARLLYRFSAGRIR